MSYGFGELIAHAAATRELCAGTVLGSGTVSNTGGASGSGCIAERRALDKLSGRALTAYLGNGETVTLAVTGSNGSSPFGTIEQTVRVDVSGG